MFFNHNIFISLILCIILFYTGYKLSDSIKNYAARVSIGILLFLLCLPGLSFIAYYLHLIETPIWYIEFRSINNIEIILSVFGLFFGFISFGIKGKIRMILLILVCILLMFIPYSKAILLPIGNNIDFKDDWSDDVSIQSSSSTCGPSSLATIFAYYGMNKTEYEIAKASFSSSTGTENWYMIRYARKNGLNAEIKYVNDLSEAPIPSIVGTNLGQIGHFITLLGKENNKYIIGDSLKGRLYLTQEEFDNIYAFKNFVIHFTQSS